MKRIGQFHQWSELPGTGHGYVRFANGRIASVNLKPDLNPDAPQALLVGQGMLREKWAQMLCGQDRELPFEVYLKRGTNKWEYMGKFVVESWTDSANEIRRHEAKSKRNDVVRVIYLRKA